MAVVLLSKLSALSRSFLSLQGKKIKCSTTQAKHRLFIGNIPKNWTVDDMKKVVAEVGPGVTSVELLKVWQYNFYYMLCGFDLMCYIMHSSIFIVNKIKKCIV